MVTLIIWSISRFLNLNIRSFKAFQSIDSKFTMPLTVLVGNLTLPETVPHLMCPGIGGRQNEAAVSKEVVILGVGHGNKGQT